MSDGLLGVSWAVWGVAALGLALVFAVWTPGLPPGGEMSLGRRLILRWFHALTWALLGLSFLTRGPELVPDGTADLLALAGLAVYVIYVVTLVRTRGRRQ